MIRLSERSKTPVPKTMRALPRSAGMCLATAAVVAMAASVAALAQAQAQDNSSLAKAGQWELVHTMDPFAKKAEKCQIQSVSETEGGHRELPLLIVDFSTKQITVRPDRVLQGAVELNRRLQGDTGDQGGRKTVIVRHGMRIDGGELHGFEVMDTGSSSLAAIFRQDTYEALAKQMSDGKVLYYLWQIPSQRKAYEYRLDGFRELMPAAREKCGMAAKSR